MSCFSVSGAKAHNLKRMGTGYRRINAYNELVCDGTRNGGKSKMGPCKEFRSGDEVSIRGEQASANRTDDAKKDCIIRAKTLLY